MPSWSVTFWPAAADRMEGHSVIAKPTLWPKRPTPDSGPGSWAAIAWKRSAVFFPGRAVLIPASTAEYSASWTPRSSAGTSEPTNQFLLKSQKYSSRIEPVSMMSTSPSCSSRSVAAPTMSSYPPGPLRHDIYGTRSAPALNSSIRARRQTSRSVIPARKSVGILSIALDWRRQVSLCVRTSALDFNVRRSFSSGVASRNSARPPKAPSRRRKSAMGMRSENSQPSSAPRRPIFPGSEGSTPSRTSDSAERPSSSGRGDGQECTAPTVWEHCS
mmetsp:Transcript_15427/g.46240  ORF Transcript_15427/g.46240 Transcript_15427/m.46240 type:complete len:273 (+) Transcript_15427:347-1165(+)